MMTDEEVMQKLEEVTKNAQQHQLETLRSILHHNGSVRYLQSFKGSVDVNTYTSVVPLSTYEDYVEYINQMADGNRDPLLSVDPLLGFFYSSGTTSSNMKPKLIPWFDSSLYKATTFIVIQTNQALLQVAMRKAVIKTLGGPQPELANRIRLICEGKNWGGIVYRLWPNIHYVRCVSTGSVQQYYQKLKYYAGDVPILGGDYFSSECCAALNLDIMQPPETTRYTILPITAYFEFLPFNTNEDNDVSKEAVALSSVQVGNMYEVVVTTYNGLYRYKMGDIVRVVGFYNSSPQVEFVMKAPKSPGEILTEKDLISGVKNFQQVLKGVMRIDIVKCASFLEQESRPKQLKVFIEVQEEDNFLEELYFIDGEWLGSYVQGAEG
ncbi:hypothetical protein RJT34_20184 [Clitoria ternatea]|uniref:GH3 middle domain-containing protein n=1 Tax=Clitoria ternatea TaxID=43366 RepID=A0AAN9ISZ9_CLITE